MNNLVVLSLGNGDLDNGFGAVTAQLWSPGNPKPMKFIGSLPAAPELSELYRYWQLLYAALYQRLDWCPRIEIEAADVTNVSEVEFSNLCQQLSNRINIWLNSEPFRHIDQQLRTHLDCLDEICFIIETNDNLLRRLPWHLWNFFEHYSKAEIALSASEYQRPKTIVTKPSAGQVRILAIFGNSKGIDVGQDRAVLEQLSEQASIEFLVEPQLEQLNDLLWQDWDILFFAGHSSSQEQGILQLNQIDAITIEQLKYALKKAISCGLKLAIFNSCDGLGLAQALGDLHIPQVIVMREPVPDVVAKEFLRHFLAAFSSGQSLYASVREARERLQKLEGEYPCATWLPVVCQNPACEPTTWQQWCSGIEPNCATSSSELQIRQILPNARRRQTVLLILSVVVTSVIMGVRQLGMLQTWELQAFDQSLQLRPDEKSDSRLLVVTVTEEDVKAQNPEQRRGSLSDRALSQLLKQLAQFKPRVIGLDIYRDFSIQRGQTDLARSLRHSDRLIAVCKVSDPKIGEPGVAPPPEIPTERLGFSDFVVDPDGIVRRQLLAMTTEPASLCTTPYAFSVQLAFRYLAEVGILPKYTADGFLQLGNVVFKPLEPNTSGYQGVDTWGHQVLLNYRSPRSVENIAAQVTLKDVLNGQLNPNSIKDRIILIGTTANSFQDYWLTPYTNGQSKQQLPGVLVQAQMVSQILSAVLDHRPVLWVWPRWGEALWVWSWSLAGGMLGRRFRSPLYLGLLSATSAVCLYGLCLGLLTQSGCWVPLVPSALALVATSGSVAAYMKFQARFHP